MNAPSPWALAADIIDPPDPTEWEPLPHQIPPSDPRSPSYSTELGATGWFVWLLLAGRGAGKTQAASRYISKYARQHPNARISIIAPTLGDARRACIEGPSGLLECDPTIKIVKTPDYYLIWPNGSRADIFGASTPEDVERLRAGGNRHVVWAEELAAWRHLQDAWDQMEFGLRLGMHPHVVASTTPKNRSLIKKLVKDPKVIVTRGSTNDNPFLHSTTRERLFARYEGTRLGRQELLGEIIEDVDGALWKRDDIEQTKITMEELQQVWNPPDHLKLALPHFEQVVVGVDPQATTSKNSQTGIVVVGRLSKGKPCPFNHGEVSDEDYEAGFTTREKRRGLTPAREKVARGHSGCLVVLDDASISGSPDAWASRAIKAFHVWEADRVCAEVNHGGDMVTSILNASDPSVPIKIVRASRGKAIRAEPVAALYEQQRVHHVAGMDDLEDQLCTWETDSDWSPDRLDALVWACTELGVNHKTHLRLIAPVSVGNDGSYWRAAP